MMKAICTRRENSPQEIELMQEEKLILMMNNQKVPWLQFE
jgi:hypothetical protein